MIDLIPPDKTLLSMPSLTALKAFAASAKYGSFTRAAEALCVSQAAISRQVRDLEDDLNVLLFKRLGKAIELTDDGKALYEVVSEAFGSISFISQKIKRKENKKNLNQLTVCTTPSFSNLWVSNNLPDFRTKHPEIEICLISIEDFNKIETNLNIDIFISPGEINHNNFINKPLFCETIYPICSPKLLKDEIKTIDDLLKHNLIHLNPFYRSHYMGDFDWQNWVNNFEPSCDVSASSRKQDLSSNSYQFVIQMALDGQGIAMGWKHLTQNLEKRGKLIRAMSNKIVFPERKHYIAYQKDLAEMDSIKKFESWMFSKF
jgi:LysR family glycine cleavage system transcriptional activator